MEAKKNKDQTVKSTKSTDSDQQTKKEYNVEKKEDIKERLSDEPDSLGINLDGTNPGSNAHQTD
ncbi:hypothetical protein ACVWYN_002956 [Pedobacter sp. UYP24]